MSAALVVLSTVALASGCCSSKTRPAEEEPPPAATVPPDGSPEATRVTLIVRTPATEVDLTGFRIAQRSAGGGVLALEGEGEPPAGVSVLTRLEGDTTKAGGLVSLLGAVERALAGGAAPGEAAIHGYLKLDLSAAPTGDAPLRSALAALGFDVQTLAGDIATGRARVAQLGPLLATGWVLQLEIARSVLPR